MGCCGQQRATLAYAARRAAVGDGAPRAAMPNAQSTPHQEPAALARPVAAPAGAPPIAGVARVGSMGLVALRYLHSPRILVRGPKTGSSYEFSAAQPVCAVDASDAEPLVRTGYFHRT
jgi:hypothetical protein